MFRATDLRVDGRGLHDETLESLDLAASEIAERPVTWRQRVYLLWLAVRVVEKTIEDNNAMTISYEIDNEQRRSVAAGVPYVERHAEQRVGDIVRMVKNIFRKREGED